MFFPIVVVLFLVLLLGVGVGTLIYAWYARQRGKLPYYAIMIILFTLIYTCHLQKKVNRISQIYEDPNEAVVSRRRLL